MRKSNDYNKAKQKNKDNTSFKKHGSRQYDDKEEEDEEEENFGRTQFRNKRNCEK